MTHARKAYSRRLERSLEALRDSTDAQLLWADPIAPGTLPRFPVYRVSPSAADFLAQVEDLAAEAEKIRLSRNLPPDVRRGVTKLTISARDKYTLRWETAGAIRQRLISELVGRGYAPEDLPMREVIDHLSKLMPRIELEKPGVQNRVKAVLELASRPAFEKLRVHYPQSYMRVYVSGSKNEQLTLRVNGLLLVAEEGAPIELNPPGSRKRAVRSDRLANTPSFTIGSGRYFFQEDWSR